MPNGALTNFAQSIPVADARSFTVKTLNQGTGNTDSSSVLIQN